MAILVAGGQPLHIRSESSDSNSLGDAYGSRLPAYPMILLTFSDTVVVGETPSKTTHHVKIQEDPSKIPLDKGHRPVPEAPVPEDGDSLCF
jgi:hypothetical protein